jgi:O-antigen/teichoic acid export membrane protein
LVGGVWKGENHRKKIKTGSIISIFMFIISCIALAAIFESTLFPLGETWAVLIPMAVILLLSLITIVLLEVFPKRDIEPL